MPHASSSGNSVSVRQWLYVSHGRWNTRPILSMHLRRIFSGLLLAASAGGVEDAEGESGPSVKVVSEKKLPDAMGRTISFGE